MLPPTLALPQGFSFFLRLLNFIYSFICAEFSLLRRLSSSGGEWGPL